MSTVVVVGLGVTGEAVARRRRAMGDRVFVVEEAPGVASGAVQHAVAARAAGAEILERPAVGEVERLVAASDLVVPSPGVRERHHALEAARRAGVPVRAEIDLAAEEASARHRPLIAVTGTNGKTTTTTLIAAMLATSGVPAVAAGNIGMALLDAVDRYDGVLVAEVSSFQLACTTAAFRPPIAVLLNVAADHLDWHGTFERYKQAKARVFEHQSRADLLVFNRDDPTVVRLARTARGRTIAFSLDRASGAFCVDGGVLLDAGGVTIAPADALPFSAPYDRANALAAAAAALEAGATHEGVARALREFRRLPHRVVRVGDAGGVAYYDDSKATNPHATLSTVRGFDAPVVLLAGGRNKGLDLGQLRVLASRLRGVVALGEAADEIEAAFSGATSVGRAVSMREAVALAAQQAHAGDVVLLSPACASFDWYESYAARGDDFAHEVARLGKRGVA